MAYGHVAVTPQVVPAGQFADLTFEVPNESETSAYNKIEVVFAGPGVVTNADAPSLAGWSVSVDGPTGAVEQVSWERGSVEPGASQSFVLSVQIPAEGDRLDFEIIQTYDDGRVDRWNQRRGIDEPEPAFPAPFVLISGGAVAPATTTTEPSLPPVTADATSASDEDDAGPFELTPGRMLIAFGLAVLVVVILRARALQKRSRSDDEDD